MITDTLHLAPLWFVAFLFSTTLHEAAHAFVALRLGDPTAYHGGQVSLNPLPHIRREPFGMIVIPILSFALAGWMFGWASAPYDPRWAHRYPKRAGWMALAGPTSNLALAISAGVLIRLGVAGGLFTAPSSVNFWRLADASGGGLAAVLAPLLSIFLSLNLLLAAFNMLPLPPFDGSAVLQLFLPDELARRFQDFLRQPMLGWIGFLVAWRVFGRLFQPLFGILLKLLYPEIQYS